MKLLFVTHTLRGGGAERVMATIASELARRDHNVHVLTLQDKPDFYPIDDKIVRRRLNIATRVSSPLGYVRAHRLRVRAIREVVRKIQPDVIVSFMDRVNVFVVPASEGRRVIVSERNNPSLSTSSFLIRLLRRIYYPKAFRVVCLSKGVCQALDWLPEEKKQVIYNPLMISPDSSFQRTTEFNFRPDRRYLISVGRLTEQKGFNTLIRAFAGIAKDAQAWDLVIFGEGHLRRVLTDMIREQGLEGRAFLPGVTKHIEAAFSRADLFVLSSVYEGFGNVIVEAMAHGCPVIVSDCNYGPAEIVSDGVTGLLVPVGDPSRLSAAMMRMIMDPDFRHTLGKQGKRSVGRFSLDRITDQWETLLSQAASHYRP